MKKRNLFLLGRAEDGGDEEAFPIAGGCVSEGLFARQPWLGDVVIPAVDQIERGAERLDVFGVESVELANEFEDLAELGRQCGCLGVADFEPSEHCQFMNFRDRECLHR